jgi:hypothetical protein
LKAKFERKDHDEQPVGVMTEQAQNSNAHATNAQHDERGKAEQSAHANHPTKDHEEEKVGDAEQQRQSEEAARRERTSSFGTQKLSNTRTS